jgi:hypothetical protein
MRAQEFILETVEDSQLINSIAAKLTAFIKQNPEEFDTTEPVAIDDLITVNSKDPNIQKLMSTQIAFADIGGPEIGGKYQHGDKYGTVEINSEFLKISLWDKIETNLVHELTHSLDDIKAKGRTYSGDSRPKYRQVGDSGDYESAPIEINARLLQAKHALAKKIQNQNYTLQSIQPEITRVLTAFKIPEYFPKKTQDPRYQQILRRMYKFAEAELLNNQQ